MAPPAETPALAPVLSVCFPTPFQPSCLYAFVNCPVKRSSKIEPVAAQPPAPLAIFTAFGAHFAENFPRPPAVRSKEIFEKFPL